MAGYWSQSASQITDANGKPIPGAKAFFYLGGTTTPLEVYRDYSLTNPHPSPLTTDGFGRFPSVFLDEADGFFDFRLTTAGGVLLYTAVQVPIIGPLGGGGGTPPAPIDPDAVMQTGDMMARYGTGLRSGWVRGNGRTIGSATSGASERADADCQNLYLYLWSADTTLAVLGGRGANAAADWGANKPLTLPDFRGRTFVGLDTMGNVAANVIPAATALGWADGEATHKLTTDEMPAHAHGINDPGHNHTVAGGTQGGTSTSTFNGGGNGAMTSPATIIVNGAFTGITIQNSGGGANHNNVQPSKGLSIYVRL
jgi:microcystin-dependent protein